MVDIPKKPKPTQTKQTEEKDVKVGIKQLRRVDNCNETRTCICKNANTVFFVSYHLNET